MTFDRDMESTIKRLIEKVLIDYDCHPGGKGFEILRDVIYLSLLEPDMTCSDLFLSYVRQKDKEADPSRLLKDKTAAYNLARRYVINSSSPEKKTYFFVKWCVSLIKACMEDHQ